SGLLTARFRNYWRLRVPEMAQTVLTFVPASREGKPDGSNAAVVDAPSGHGRQFGIATSADLTGSSWPMNASFVPLVQKMLLAAVTGMGAPATGEVGRTLEWLLPDTARDAMIVTPDERQMPALLTPLPGGVSATVADPETAGFYRCRVSD